MRSTHGCTSTPNLNKAGPGGQPGTTLQSSVAGYTLNTGTSEQPLPNPNTTLRPLFPSRHGPITRALNKPNIAS